MRIVFINVVTLLLSLLIMAFGVWTYTQALYHDKVVKYFQEKQETKISNLKEASLLSDKIVLLKGKIIATESFEGKDKTKVVIERYREEKKTKNSKKDWKVIKENSFFKAIPFKLQDKTNSNVLIDSNDIDKTFLGDPQIKQEETDTEILQKNLWQFKNNDTVYVMGELENKAGNYIVSNPNMKKSFFETLTSKDPFIITKYSPKEMISKSKDIGNSIHYSSIAVFIVSGFIFINGLMTIFKNIKSGDGEN